MLVLRKKHLKRVGLVTLIVLAVAALAVGITAAAGSQTITIITEPIKFDEMLYVDLNHNGEHEADELVGIFDVYDGNEPITFSWEPYAFASGVNGSYRIALWQNTTPFEATPTWAEYKVSHHWADNPDGTTFTMGAFGFGETICTTCPTMIVVQAETYEKVFDWNTSTYVYEYTLIGGSPYMAALNGGGATQTSGEFIIEIFRPEPECGHPFKALIKEMCEHKHAGWGDALYQPANQVIGSESLQECIDQRLALFSELGGVLGDYGYNPDTGTCTCNLTQADCDLLELPFSEALCICPAMAD